MTDLLTRPDTEAPVVTEYETTTDKTKASHIVIVPPGEPDQTPQAYVLRAQIEGFPVTALCGHTWVPYQNPGSLPVCKPCLDIYEQDGENSDERKERLPDA